MNDDFKAHGADSHEDAQERETSGREQVHDRNYDAGGAAEQTTESLIEVTSCFRLIKN